MEQPEEAEDLKLCLCSSGVKSSEIKPGTNPKCVFCAMRSYGYYAEYKVADRRCDTVGAKDSDTFQDRLMVSCIWSKPPHLPAVQRNRLFRAHVYNKNIINELQLWLATTVSHTAFMTKIMVVEKKYQNLGPNSTKNWTLNVFICSLRDITSSSSSEWLPQTVLLHHIKNKQTVKPWKRLDSFFSST